MVRIISAILPQSTVVPSRRIATEYKKPAANIRGIRAMRVRSHSLAMRRSRCHGKKTSLRASYASAAWASKVTRRVCGGMKVKLTGIGHKKAQSRRAKQASLRTPRKQIADSKQVLKTPIRNKESKTRTDSSAHLADNQIDPAIQSNGG